MSQPASLQVRLSVVGPASVELCLEVPDHSLRSSAVRGATPSAAGGLPAGRPSLRREGPCGALIARWWRRRNTFVAWWSMRLHFRDYLKREGLDLPQRRRWSLSPAKRRSWEVWAQQRLERAAILLQAVARRRMVTHPMDPLRRSLAAAVRRREGHRSRHPSEVLRVAIQQARQLRLPGLQVVMGEVQGGPHVERFSGRSRGSQELCEVLIDAWWGVPGSPYEDSAATIVAKMRGSSSAPWAQAFVIGCRKRRLAWIADAVSDVETAQLSKVVGRLPNSVKRALGKAGADTHVRRVKEIAKALSEVRAREPPPSTIPACRGRGAVRVSPLPPREGGVSYRELIEWAEGLERAPVRARSIVGHMPSHSVGFSEADVDSTLHTNIVTGGVLTVMGGLLAVAGPRRHWAALIGASVPPATPSPITGFEGLVAVTLTADGFHHWREGDGWEEVPGARLGDAVSFLADSPHRIPSTAYGGYHLVVHCMVEGELAVVWPVLRNALEADGVVKGSLVPGATGPACLYRALCDSTQHLTDVRIAGRWACLGCPSAVASLHAATEVIRLYREVGRLDLAAACLERVPLSIRAAAAATAVANAGPDGEEVARALAPVTPGFLPYWVTGAVGARADAEGVTLLRAVLRIQRALRRPVKVPAAYLSPTAALSIPARSGGRSGVPCQVPTWASAACDLVSNRLGVRCVTPLRAVKTDGDEIVEFFFDCITAPVPGGGWAASRRAREFLAQQVGGRLPVAVVRHRDVEETILFPHHPSGDLAITLGGYAAFRQGDPGTVAKLLLMAMVDPFTRFEPMLGITPSPRTLSPLGSRAEWAESLVDGGKAHWGPRTRHGDRELQWLTASRQRPILPSGVVAGPRDVRVRPRPGDRMGPRRGIQTWCRVQDGQGLRPPVVSEGGPPSSPGRVRAGLDEPRGPNILDPPTGKTWIIQFALPEVHPGPMCSLQEWREARNSVRLEGAVPEVEATWTKVPPPSPLTRGEPLVPGSFTRSRPGETPRYASSGIGHTVPGPVKRVSWVPCGRGGQYEAHLVGVQVPAPQGVSPPPSGMPEQVAEPRVVRLGSKGQSTGMAALSNVLTGSPGLPREQWLSPVPPQKGESRRRPHKWGFEALRGLVRWDAAASEGEAVLHQSVLEGKNVEVYTLGSQSPEALARLLAACVIAVTDPHQCGPGRMVEICVLQSELRWRLDVRARSLDNLEFLRCPEAVRSSASALAATCIAASTHSSAALRCVLPQVSLAHALEGARGALKRLGALCMQDAAWVPWSAIGSALTRAETCILCRFLSKGALAGAAVTTVPPPKTLTDPPPVTFGIHEMDRDEWLVPLFQTLRDLVPPPTGLCRACARPLDAGRQLNFCSGKRPFRGYCWDHNADKLRQIRSGGGAIGASRKQGAAHAAVLALAASDTTLADWEPLVAPQDEAAFIGLRACRSAVLAQNQWSVRTTVSATRETKPRTPDIPCASLGVIYRLICEITADTMPETQDGFRGGQHSTIEVGQRDLSALLRRSERAFGMPSGSLGIPCEGHNYSRLI